ncbi:MotA/TolQ/ExbB proton channel family protein [Rubritalea spongiae]|uniref:MotA/TolQ/ExbB proton channel family protein n=1 Tax=Rubritalea spongiae TaxID=430797 RepID=A0ABW5E2C9_9BACT
MKLSVLLLLFGLAVSLQAEEKNEHVIQLSAEDLQEDIDRALERLAQQREERTEERVALGEKVAKLEKQLLELRRKRDIARLSSEGRKELLYDLEVKKAKFEKDFHYMRGLYRDFAVQLENQLQLGQEEAYQESIDLAIETESSLIDQAGVVDSALDRLESVLGGERRSAKVVSSDQVILTGEVLNVGPASWFQQEGGSTAGVVYTENGASRARLIEKEAGKVQKLFKGELVELNVDVTGGKARAIDQIQGDSGRIFEKGGTWLWVILSIAFVSALCGVMKLIQLSKIKDPKNGWVAEILTAVRAGKTEEAEQLAKQAKHPVGEVLSNALAYTSAGADVVEEVIYEQLIGVQSRLQKWLPFIAVTAATAPLLGLLGTVSGMIRMFNVITVTGTGDVKPMAGGISEALITTLFGLIVAIPALILHTMLSRKSNGVVQNTEKLGLTFVNGLRKLN